MGLLDFWKKAAEPKKPADPAKLHRQLMNAVADRDYSRVQKALRKGADPNAANGQALADAFHSQSWAIVTLLIDKGADPGQLSLDPMDTALRNGQDKLAKQLYKKGFKPDTTDSTDNALFIAVDRRDYDMINWLTALPEIDARFGNEKPLQHAFKNQYWHCVTLLMDQGADPKALPFDPLDKAIRGGQERLAQRLYKQGFKPDTTDSTDNALFIAVDRRDYDMINWLTTLPEIDARFGNEKPLQHAFKNQYWHCVTLLMDQGADPKALPFDPLDKAIRGGQERLAQRLYKQGFKPDTTDSTDNALFIAVDRRDYDMINWLTTLPEIDARFGNEKPLQHAFEHQYWYCVTLLMDQGADPKALPFDPLDKAIRGGQERLAQRLYKQGFKPDTTDSTGNALFIAVDRRDYDMINWLTTLPEIDASFGNEKPLQHAFKNQYWHCVTLLMDQGADPKALPFDPLDKAIRGGQEHLVKRLYKMGFKPNTETEDQHALMAAVKRGDADVVLKLLAMPEIDVHFNNEAPLQSAFENEKWYIATLLLDAGADPGQLPFDPMHRAAGRGQDSIMKKLHKLGIPVDTVTDGQTPLSAAAGYGDMDSVNWLLKKNADVHAARNAALKAAATRKKWHIATILMNKGADGTFLLSNPDLPEETRILAEKTALKASARQTVDMLRRVKQRQARRKAPNP